MIEGVIGKLENKIGWGLVIDRVIRGKEERKRNEECETGILGGIVEDQVVIREKR